MDLHLHEIKVHKEIKRPMKKAQELMLLGFFDTNKYCVLVKS
jgi:hypothetical protein